LTPVRSSDNLQNIIDSVAMGSGTSSRDINASVYQQQQLQQQQQQQLQQQQQQQQQLQQQQIQQQQILNVPIKQEFIKTIKQEKTPKKRNDKRFMCCYCPWSGMCQILISVTGKGLVFAEKQQTSVLPLESNLNSSVFL
jgi:type II secretory pathway pseudopilin PulG